MELTVKQIKDLRSLLKLASKTLDTKSELKSLINDLQRMANI